MTTINSSSVTNYFKSCVNGYFFFLYGPVIHFTTQFSLQNKNSLNSCVYFSATTILRESSQSRLEVMACIFSTSTSLVTTWRIQTLLCDWMESRICVMRKLIWIALVSQITELRHVGWWPPCQEVRVDSLEVKLRREIMVGVLFYSLYFYRRCSECCLCCWNWWFSCQQWYSSLQHLHWIQDCSPVMQ